MIAGISRLNDFPWIDRTKSEIDDEKSNPETGTYYVKDGGNKVVYSAKLPDGGRAKYHYHWIENTPARISMVKIQKGYTEVTTDDDIVPEGMTCDALHHYVYGDLIFMKCSLEQYLERILHSRKRSDLLLAAKKREFTNKAKSVNAGMDENLLEDILGEMV